MNKWSSVSAIKDEFEADDSGRTSPAPETVNSGTFDLIKKTVIVVLTVVAVLILLPILFVILRAFLSGLLFGKN